MKRSHWLLMMAVCSVSAVAHGAESCPAVTDIKLNHAIYLAPTEASGSEWIGVSAAEPATPLTEFVSGVFYPKNNQEVIQGRLGYCEYKAQDGSLINVHYRNSSSSSDSMRLENVENWEKSISELGLVRYECTSAVANACAFTANN